VNPDLIVRDKEGKPYTVRYEAVNAMLLNEFLKEHRQVQDLKAIVAGQQKQIEALTAGLQKVSAQVEASKTAPQVVADNH
jgi:cell division FtsZ-interacting protein ZapD